MKIELDESSSDGSDATSSSNDSGLTADAEADVERVALKLVDVYYTIETAGYQQPEPILHVTARDEEKNRHDVEIEGFHPYFCLSQSELDSSMLVELPKDERVRGVKPVGDADIHQQPVVKVETVKPLRFYSELVDAFDNPLEGDVGYTDRFLIDSGIKQGFTVPQAPLQHGETVPYSAVEAVEDHEVESVRPRILTFDIEVKQNEGTGPSVVSEEGTELARQPVTAITAHDSYEDTYASWLLAHADWTQQQREALASLADSNDTLHSFNLFESERAMLSDFIETVKTIQPDVITGWNSNGFDVPYIVNRCLKEQDLINIRDWSPTQDLETMNGEGRWLNSDFKGVICFDLLMGFEKTSVHELKSKSLSNVADAVLDDMEKLDVGELDDAWRENPCDFLKYSIRDVEAVVNINREAVDGGIV